MKIGMNTNLYKYNSAKTTEGQQKKHVKQMTMQETSYLYKRINQLNLNNTRFSKHFFDNNRNIRQFEVIDMLKKRHYQLIEYNQTPQNRTNTMEERVLLRTDITTTIHETIGNRTITSIVNLCVVVSLTNNCIVTGYYNKVDDKHYTINWSRYCKDLQIIDVRV